MIHLLLLKACYVVWPFGLLFVAWFGCYGIVLAVWIWKKCSSAQFSCVGAMASWDVQDLLKEIADMEVISMRNHSSDLLPKMQQALVSKIECTQLITPSNYVKIMDCLEKTTLPDQTKQALSTSIESKCAAGVEGPATLQIKPQSMTMPWNYLCKSEWDKIQAEGCTTVEASHILIKRIKLCGLKSLKEDTKKFITCMLVALQMQLVNTIPSKQQMYSMAQSVSAAFGALAVDPLYGGLSKYPPSPYELGEAWLLKTETHL